MDFKCIGKILHIAIYGGVVLLLKEFKTTMTATVCPGDTVYDVSEKKCACPKDMFYDRIVKSCTHCYQICQNAVLQGTEDDCNKFCPGYQLPAMDMPLVKATDATEKNCPGDMHYDKIVNQCSCQKDEYYDEVTRTCSACYDICSNAEIQNTVDVCMFSCPNYRISYSTTLLPLPGINESKIIVISVCVSAGIVFIFIVFTWCCRSRLDRQFRQICSILVDLLQCVTRDVTRDAIEDDKHNTNVQPDTNKRLSGMFYNKQPQDQEEAVPIVPSGNAIEDGDQETETKRFFL